MDKASMARVCITFNYKKYLFFKNLQDYVQKKSISLSKKVYYKESLSNCNDCVHEIRL